MKVFLKFVKIISYICTIFVCMLVIKLIVQGLQLINYEEVCNNLVLILALYPIAFSIIAALILLVYLTIFFPRFIKHIKSLERDMELCTKEEILKLISFLIIVAIIIGTIIYIHFNIK